MFLSEIRTKDLFKVLLGRNDIFESPGVLTYEAYLLAAGLLPMPCVDGVAVRRRGDGKIEGMAIRRGTGREKGKLCSVGGRILRNESIEQCLRRQFRTDLSCEIESIVSWSHPILVAQFAPAEDVHGDPAFSPEYTKHAISSYFPVKLLGEPRFGSTSHGGQEVLAIEWLTLENFPDYSQFGYDQGPKIYECIEAAEELI